MLRFQKVENVFRYAPIFKILYDESLIDSAWNALSSGHFTIELNSMLDYPKEIAFDWEADIPMDLIHLPILIMLILKNALN